jgi:hypothetical protein
MNKLLTVGITAGLVILSGSAIADSHEGAGLETATPVEIFTCTYNEGKGHGDLGPILGEWNEWADAQGLKDYSAWILTPYYSSPEQDFDMIWLGGSPSAVALGRAQDAWIATGGKLQKKFDEVVSCSAHTAFATLEFKQPPERKNPDNVVISFSDCNVDESTSFIDLVPAMMEWAAYREGHGSTSGMWAMMPAMGGGGEDFDFKWVTAYQNLEDFGADFDQYSESGWKKGGELFAGKLSCDSSRIYLAANHRRAESSDD